jgi:hypothetical protein
MFTTMAAGKKSVGLINRSRGGFLALRDSSGSFEAPAEAVLSPSDHLV